MKKTYSKPEIKSASILTQLLAGSTSMNINEPEKKVEDFNELL